LSEDIGEQHNWFGEKPGLVKELLATMDKLVRDGRSTPGEPQANDVPVKWRRYMPEEKLP
jgi:hypothetical protein